MTKSEAQQRKTKIEAELQALNEIINAPEVPKEQRFWELINGLQLKVDFAKYPDTIFFFNGNVCWVEYNLKSGYLGLRYSTIWSVFEKYGLNYNQIQSFIKGRVEEHFKMKGVTPNCCPLSHLPLVEEHFKMKGVTPPASTRKLVYRWKNISNKNK